MSTTFDTSTLAVGEEATFLPASPTGDPGYWNAYADDEPIKVTVADDGVTLDTPMGAGFFPNGVTITQMGDRAARWKVAS